MPQVYFLEVCNSFIPYQRNFSRVSAPLCYNFLSMMQAKEGSSFVKVRLKNWPLDFRWHEQNSPFEFEHVFADHAGSPVFIQHFRHIQQNCERSWAQPARF